MHAKWVKASFDTPDAAPFESRCLFTKRKARRQLGKNETTIRAAYKMDKSTDKSPQIYEGRLIILFLSLVLFLFVL